MEKGTMKRAAAAGIAAICLLLIVNPVQVWAWGNTGHRVLAEVGAKLTGSQTFWSANEVAMGELTNVPDKVWKAGKNGVEERPTHYFEPDGYYSDPSDFIKIPLSWSAAVKMYSEPVVVAHGTAMWRIRQLYDLAVAKAIKSDFKATLQLAGTMSHYIGDLSQPLHVTTNYDGQDTGQKGIHKFFETTNIEGRDYEKLKKEITDRANRLLRDPQFMKQNRVSLDKLILNLVMRTYDYKDLVLEVDAADGRTGVGAENQLELAKDRMADGAATLAIVLATAWKAAGSPKNVQSISVDTPGWVAPEYAKMKRRGEPVSFFEVKNYAPDFVDCE